MLKRGLVEMPPLAVYPSITALADDTGPQLPGYLAQYSVHRRHSSTWHLYMYR